MMKRVITGEKRLPVLARRRLAISGQRLLDRTQFGNRDVLRRQARCLHLLYTAKVKKLADALRRYEARQVKGSAGGEAHLLADENAAAAPRAYDTGWRHHLDRIAHDGAAHAELLAELLLSGQAVAGAQVMLADVLHDQLSHALVARPIGGRLRLLDAGYGGHLLGGSYVYTSRPATRK